MLPQQLVEEYVSHCDTPHQGLLAVLMVGVRHMIEEACFALAAALWVFHLRPMLHRKFEVNPILP